MMRRFHPLLRLVLVLCCILSPRAAIAGPILVDCDEADKWFLGVVGHGQITVNDWDSLGQYFTAVCGMTKWNVHWIVHEFEQNGNLPDEILFRPITGTHLIAVPGHTPENAPSDQSIRLPRMMYMAPRAPVFGFPPIVIPGTPALHTFHADGVIRLLMVFSNNRDVLMYFAGVTMYHSSDPLIYFGAVSDAGATQDSAVGGLVVASPDSNEISLTLAMFSSHPIERAILSINGYDKRIELDVGDFKAQAGGFKSYLNPELSLNGAKAEDLFISGGTISIQTGKTEILGVIRMKGEVDHKKLLKGG